MVDVKDKIKAIIFDMDGTIIRTEHIWGIATTETLANNGFVEFNESQRKALNSLSGVGIFRAWEKLKHEFELQKDVSFLVEETVQAAFRHFKKGIEFVEGFQSFHESISGLKIPSGVATNADEKSLIEIGNILNFHKYFGSNVYGIAQVNNKAKPDPAIFLHAAQKLGAKPHECVVFEDSMVGMQAALAAGMKCIAIKHTANEHSRHHAHEAIDNYNSALEALNKVIGK